MENESAKCILCDSVLMAQEAEDVHYLAMEVSHWYSYCPNMSCSRYGLVVVEGLTKPPVMGQINQSIVDAIEKGKNL